MGEVANYIPGGADIGSAGTQGGAQFAGGGGFSPSGFTNFGGVLPQASAFGDPAFSQLPQFPTTSEPGFGIGPDAPTTAPAAAPTPSAALGGGGEGATSFINSAQQAALTGGVYTDPITGQIPQGDIPPPPAATSGSAGGPTTASAGTTPAVSSADIQAAIGNQPPDMLSGANLPASGNTSGFFGGLKDILKTVSPYLNVAGAGYGLASALGKRGQLDPGLALAQQQAQQQLNAISNLQSTDPVPQLMANKTAARNNAAANLSRLGFKPGDTVYEQTMAGIESQYAMQTQQLQMQNQTQLQQAEAQANRNVLTEALAASKYYQDQDKALADAIGNAVGAFGKLV